MRNIGRVLLISITLLAILSIVAFGSGTIPGSEEDPVVTMSYVSNQINELKAYVDSRLANLNPDDDQEAIDTNTNTNTNNNTNTNTMAAYEIINLMTGQKIIGKESTEMILRSGEAQAVVSGVNGISDLTEGKDIQNGEIISQNHLLLVPRDDGRGILALTEIYVMVKGDYSIE